MAWYDEAIFYHIYPLGLTGAPKTNSYGKPEHRLNTLLPWIGHIKEIGCNALYIGPLFESVGHGYETTNYKKLDSRLGTNEDLTAFVEACHKEGIRVILDGVFNHTGRDFFAFRDIKRNRENSPYRDWYCNVNFGGNNSYNDGFSYDNWGGYDLLVKLNQHNPAVKNYICDVIRFWAKEFKIDGIRLDAADVLDFEYMHALRQTANEIGPDFWLMGEVIHGDYSRWVNEGTLHSVTNYHLHKALYSGHNDHNYFEIAHTVRRLYEMGGNRPGGLKLYNFVDNHDVERIYTKLTDKAQFVPVHILLYTLPGVPSIYYGSEFGIEGKKERYSDDSIRPMLSLEDYKDAKESNPCTKLISGLGKVRQKVKALSYGDYKELALTNRQYGFARNYEGESVLVAVNNDENEASMSLPAGDAPKYREMLSGEVAEAEDGRINIRIPANSGGIWVPVHEDGKTGQEEEAPVVGKDVLKLSEAVKPKKPERPEKAEEPENCEEPEKPEKPTEPVHVKVPKQAPDEECANGSKQVPGEEYAKVPKQAPDKECAKVPKQAPDKECAKVPKQAPDEEYVNRPKQMPARDEKTEKPEEQETAKEVETVKEPETAKEPEKSAAGKKDAPAKPKTYEEMSIEELQQAILDRMAKNGPITDRMRQDVMENVYHNSLINWIKSFR